MSIVASRRSMDHVSVLIWLIILSDQLLIITLMRAPSRADSSFCSLAYGVLAVISSYCSPPKGRVACFGFGAFHVIGLYGPGIWVSDPYGLTGRVQAINPARGVEVIRNMRLKYFVFLN
ncbi:hypothetical protein G4B88_023736 [Cannabis sativa]|uniref:Uncharacterized protein n=1 Tax=Cannabis sativa TaxID=3483 RepID=A0A7J6HV82_CANSA|nr:hypothetical protein G4B88_023736 [Cannabis sativa]